MELWETTLKHRCLQELIDEQDHPRRPRKIDPNVIGQLFEEKREAIPSNESINQEVFKETFPSYSEGSSLESVQVDSLGQKASSDQQRTTKHRNLPVIEAERIGQTRNWIPDEVELPEDAKAYFLSLFVTIDIQEDNNQLEFFITSVPNANGLRETVSEWVVTKDSRNEKVKDLKPKVGPFGPFDLSDLANTPRRISLKLGDRVIPVFDLKLKKG